MTYIARYVFGSSDSIDQDVCYVVSEMPQDCKKIVDSIRGENANLITIENGVVAKCYKGTPDEMNNCLFYTYKNHLQEFPLLITRSVERNQIHKDIRAIRSILSHLSRTSYRPVIKEALRGALEKRIDCLLQLDFNTIDFSITNKKFSGESSLKVIAFQIGQALALHRGIELYTKREIAEMYPILTPYLYRQTVEAFELNWMKDFYCAILRRDYIIRDCNNEISIINGQLWNIAREERAEE